MSPDETPIPAGIAHDKTTHELKITWKDGQESVYPLDALREACPCAACRGGHEFMGEKHNPDLTLPVDRHVELENIQIVGNYALQMWWSDGHDSGIYTWAFLRRIDPALKQGGA